MLRSISRRAFLKQSSSTLALAALPPLPPEDQAARREGRWMRVTTWRARVHSEPHPKAPRVGERDYDAIVTILDEVTGVGHFEHNPSWYRIVGGYTYSSWVQPVETVFNRPVKRIEAPGMLAWVTLPYTDVRAGLDPNLQRGSRLYDDAIFRVFDLLIFDDGTQSVFWRWQVGSAWALIFQGNKALASPGECKESIRLCESSLTKRPLTLRGQRGGRCPWCRPSPMRSKLASQNLRRPPFMAYQERKPTHCPSLRQTSEVSGEPPVRTTSEVLR